MTDEATKDAPQRPCPAGKNCGGQYEHDEPLFKGMDYFFMAVGISSRPVPIQKKCALCSHVWEVTEPRRPW
ncbi:MAG: hypothetical protein KDA24_28930 [Deltaproteobacteria bacterium]|nr:hypothetical protein [Deltaproteobacteria bacterium]